MDGSDSFLKNNLRKFIVAPDAFFRLKRNVRKVGSGFIKFDVSSTFSVFSLLGVLYDICGLETADILTDIACHFHKR